MLGTAQNRWLANIETIVRAFGTARATILDVIWRSLPLMPTLITAMLNRGCCANVITHHSNLRQMYLCPRKILLKSLLLTSGREHVTTAGVHPAVHKGGVVGGGDSPFPNQPSMHTRGHLRTYDQRSNTHSLFLTSACAPCIRAIDFCSWHSSMLRSCFRAIP